MIGQWEKLFYAIDAFPGDARPLSYPFIPQRGWADTPEDRVLAHGIDSVFQDPVPGR
jgi:hypothetical protein